MATMQNIAEGLLILAKYCKPEKQTVSAEHDIIYAGEPNDAMTDADKLALDELGWFIDSEYSCYAHHT